MTYAELKPVPRDYIDQIPAENKSRQPVGTRRLISSTSHSPQSVLSPTMSAGEIVDFRIRVYTTPAFFNRPSSSGERHRIPP
jgi:hypothetical protein